MPCADSIDSSESAISWVIRSWTPNRRVSTRTSRVSLRDPDDLLVGDVGDPRPTDEWQDVVLAQPDERDRALDDLGELAVRAAVALRRERRQELRVTVVAIGRVVDRPEEPARRVDRARRGEVQSERLEDLAHVPLVPVPISRTDVARCARGWGEEAVHRLRQGDGVLVSVGDV